MIGKFVQLLCVAAVLAVSNTMLAGCNTMSGLGQDIERGGEKLEGAAERAKK